MRSIISTRPEGSSTLVGQSGRGSSLEISPGCTSDHLLVPELMQTAGIPFSEDNFISRLDEPAYEPTDRRVVRKDGKLLAHMHSLHGTAWFGESLLPWGGVTDLAFLPEFHDSVLESQVLGVAERSLCDAGAIVAFTRTYQLGLFKRSGWQTAGCQGASQVNVHDLLAQLSPKATQAHRRKGTKVRIWRKVELDALMPVYRRAANSGWGVIERNEPYWRWLCGRYPNTVVLVACGQDKQKGDCNNDAIQAYAVVRGSEIVELRYRKGRESAGPKLLVRICQDAIEQDRRELTLQAPASEPLHELLITAGGSWQTPTGTNNEQLMVKLLDREKWIHAMAPLWQRRLTAAKCRLPFSIGFRTPRRLYKFSVSLQGATLQTATSLSGAVRCEQTAFDALLLGCDDVRSLLARGALSVRTDRMSQILTALFSPNVYWQSPLDWNG